MASKILREHSRGWAESPAQDRPAGGQVSGESRSQEAGAAQTRAGDRRAAAAEKTRAVGRASRRFGEAVWGPFVHISSVLWLEVTGSFFAIFALFFAQSVYRLRHAWLAGQEHTKFILYVAIMLAFAYFACSSFYRARRKGRRARR